MEKIEWKEDPVIEEIQTIRRAIHEEIKGMSHQERADWYNAQAEEALRKFRASRESE